jgi:L-lactate dehydrogenase complex protein LldG
MNSQINNKNIILEAIRSHVPSWHYDYTPITDTSNYFIQPKEPLTEWFKKTLEALSGTCIISKNIEETISYIKQKTASETIYCTDTEIQTLLTQYEIQFSDSDESSRFSKFSVTHCEALVARTGSVIVSSNQITGRRPIASSEVHIVIAYAKQLYADFPQAFSIIESKYQNAFPSQITSITGPSRTADIEKTLVLGAHGPKELIVLLIEK